MAWQAGLTADYDPDGYDPNGSWSADFLYSASQEDFYSQQADPPPSDEEAKVIKFVKAGAKKTADETVVKKIPEETTAEKDEKAAAAKTADEASTSKEEVSERASKEAASQKN